MYEPDAPPPLLILQGRAWGLALGQISEVLGVEARAAQRAMQLALRRVAPDADLPSAIDALVQEGIITRDPDRPPEGEVAGYPDIDALALAARAMRADGAAGAEEERYLRAGWTVILDQETREACHRGEFAVLTPTQMRLLGSFIRAPDEVISREQLALEHWRGVADPDTVSNVIMLLRRALGEEVVHTVPGRGYRLGIAPGSEAPSRASLQAGELTLYVDWRELGLRSEPGSVVALSERETRFAALLFRRVGRRATDAELMRATGYEPELRRAFRLMVFGFRSELRRLGVEHLLVRLPKGYRLASGTSGVRRVAGLELDPGARTGRMHGRPLDLYPRSLAVLDLLTEAPDRIVSRTELRDRIWGPDGKLSRVDAVIGDLRAALGSGGSRFIVQAGDGYRIPIKAFGLIAVGPLLLDPSSNCVRLDGEEAQLSEQEFVVLKTVVVNRGRLVDRETVSVAAGIGRLSQLAAVLTRTSRRVDRLLRHRANQLPVPGEARLIVPMTGAGYRLAIEWLDLDAVDWPLRFAGHLFQPAARLLRRGRQVVTVEPAPSRMLALLMGAQPAPSPCETEQGLALGAIVEQHELCRSMWPSGNFGPRSLRTCRNNLQRTFDRVGGSVRVEWAGAGYRLREVAQEHRREVDEP